MWLGNSKMSNKKRKFATPSSLVDSTEDSECKNEKSEAGFISISKLIQPILCTFVISAGTQIVNQTIHFKITKNYLS